MIGESKVRLLIVMSVAALLAGCATYISPLTEVAPKEAVCPSGVPAGVKCFRGRDSANSHYLIAVPQK